MTSLRESPRADEPEGDDGPHVYGVSMESGRARFDRRTFIEMATTGAVVVAAEACGGGDDDRTVSADPTSTTTPPSDFFEDQFDGALGDGWRWRSEDPDLWSLTATPGWLQITAVEAAQNVLVRDAPQDPFEVTTALRFRPTSNFQFAGLIVGPDETNFLQLGRAYCDPVDVPDFCVGDGVYLDNVRDNEMLASSTVEIAPDTDVVYLRFIADRDSYAGYVSEDGESWTLVGEYTRFFTDTEIGLLAHQATRQPAVAEFDYITVTTPADQATTTTSTSTTTTSTTSTTTTTTTTTTVPPREGTVPPGENGIELDIEGRTYTLPCGSPIPAGATCTCNCVDVPSCSCVGDTGCSCVGHSSCATVSHYWYPN